MTGRQDGDPVTAVSPALVLRRAVSPAAVGYGILARQKERVGALAEQAEQLLGATRDFLESAGLAHLLGPAPNVEMHGTGAVGATGTMGATGAAGKQTEIVAAYASAGLQWARVMSAAAALGETLIAVGEWDSARRLAAALDGTGEAQAAENLNTGLRERFVAKQRQMLAQISGDMQEPEIALALEIARSAWYGFRKYAPDEARRIMPQYLEYINLSITKFNWRNKAGRLDSNAQWHLTYQRLVWADGRKAEPGEIEPHLDYLTHTFEFYKKARLERWKRLWQMSRCVKLMRW